jgi:hypothetical protein
MMSSNVEYKVFIRMGTRMVEFHPPTPEGWRDRAHACEAANSVAAEYRVERSVDGGKWGLVAERLHK